MLCWYLSADKPFQILSESTPDTPFSFLATADQKKKSPLISWWVTLLKTNQALSAFFPLVSGYLKTYCLTEQVELLQPQKARMRRNTYVQKKQSRYRDRFPC